MVLHLLCYFETIFSILEHCSKSVAKKNLIEVRKHQDSHFISTLLQLCFFCAKSKVCFPVFSQQENSSFSHFVVLLQSLKVFF